MKGILFIPHHPWSPGVKIRINEMAAAMTDRATVYLLNWRTATGNRTLLRRGIVALSDVLKRTSSRQQGNLTIIECSTLHRPIWLARLYNRLMLARAIRRLNIDVLVNGSYYLFSASRRRAYKYIVDLADLPADPSAPYVDRHTRMECRAADAVTAVSPGLAAYARTAYGCAAHWVPNGVDLHAMNAVTPEDVARLRERLNIQHAYVVGYVGFIGSWVNVAMTVGAFHRFRNTHPDAVLLFLGDAPNLDHLRQTYASQHVRFIGPVMGPIEPWFRLLDMGLLPHRQSPFQDMAFHLKLIEYTAAGIPVVSTRLKTSVNLGLPNMLCADETENDWLAAMLCAFDMPRHQSLQDTVRTFDWHSIAAAFSGIIEGL